MGSAPAIDVFQISATVAAMGHGAEVITTAEYADVNRFRQADRSQEPWMAATASSVVWTALAIIRKFKIAA